MRGSGWRSWRGADSPRASRFAAFAGIACASAIGAGCWPDPEFSQNTGALGGQVVISGPLRSASITVDQIDPHSGELDYHVGDTITDSEGRFSLVEIGYANGLLRVIARGGNFTDLATGATIQLDHTDELTSLTWFDLAESRDEILVSPVGHLVDARARVTLEAIGDMTGAVKDASAHLHRHFGDADWMRLQLIGLDRPAISPTEPVRAGLIQAALSYLARDIAAAAGASVQEVNVFELTRLWARDLLRGPSDSVGARPVFDGNDGNERRPGSGLQLGACAPVAPSCQAPPTLCNTGHCRSACDLYVGTPRALLGGAMTKVIRDNGPGGVNQTGLRIEDTLAIARSMSDNVDPDLFGGACVETLDRTAPMLRWDEDHSTAADAIVRGVIPMKAIAIDDTDPRPRVEISGYTDADGDASNNIAIANIDTTGTGDGNLTVTARVVDQAGNSALIERRVIVDNTPPQLALALAPASFFVDGDTWWTTSAAPTLTGTVVDASPATVQATIGAAQVAGTISGGSWSVTLPADAIDLAGATVTIRVADRAGNHAELTQRLRRDASPPALSFQTSAVNDEAPEVPTFTSGNLFPAQNHIPVHVHSGPTVNLDVVSACPSVTKYSYLLGAEAPAYGAEIDSLGNPRRNPIRYQLVAADDGVGIAPGSTQYRVGRRTGATTTWLFDWTSTGTGTPIAPGVTQHGVGIFSSQVAGLATTEGIYDVEFRAADRLGRTTTATRCFDLKLKAPPLELLSETTPVTPHTYQLDALSLAHGAPFDLVAARLLNDDATGASLIDQPFFNGTASTIYLTVKVTKPTQVNTAMSYVIDHARRFSDNTVSLNCSAMDGNPADCIGPAPRYLSGLVSSSSVTATFRVRVFELDSSEVPTAELPCIGACDPSMTTTFKFAIPPRPSPITGAPAKKYIAMTMIGPIPALRPNGGAAPTPPTVMPPFVDAPIGPGMPRLTGLVKPFVVLCTKVEQIGPITNKVPYCKERSELIPYRALSTLRLYSPKRTRSEYAIAPTDGVTPIPTGVEKERSEFDRTLTEGTLPTAYPYP